MRAISAVAAPMRSTPPATIRPRCSIPAVEPPPVSTPPDGGGMAPGGAVVEVPVAGGVPPAVEVPPGGLSGGAPDGGVVGAVGVSDGDAVTVGPLVGVALVGVPV